MPPILPPQQVLKCRSSGFALVIALSLMAFVLLLLLSLSTFIRVESISSAQRIITLASKQNALVALSEALGELQSLAGPDQRITATGGLWDSPATGAEHLVGVWSSEDLDEDGTADGDFQRWLVSRQNVIEARNIGLGASPQPVDFDGERFVSTDDRFALLVGSGSVELDPSRPGSMPAVVAEMKPILGTSGSLSGQYAWWIGDEGSKTRFDLLDSFAFDELSTYDSSVWGDPLLRGLLTTQSMKGSGITALDAFKAIDLSGSTSQPEELSRSQSLNQLALLEFDPDVEQRITQVKRHFHDLTSQSIGLQTNTYEGGLKRDLSLLFEQTDSAYNNPSSAFMQAIAAEGLLYTNAPGPKPTLPLIFKQPVGGSGGSEIYGPSWDLLRDYYRLYKGVASSVQDDASQRALPQDWVHTFAPGKSWFLSSEIADTEQEAWIRSLAQISWRMLGPTEPFETSVSYTRMNTNGYKEAKTLKSVPSVRATKGAYLPLLSRFTVLYSTIALPSSTGSGYDLDIVVQPFIAIHNPYNITIKAPQMRLLQELDRFEVAVRRDDGNGWDDSKPFRTGNPDATNQQFLGNVYSTATGTTGQRLSASALFIPNGNNDPYVFGKWGREITYQLQPTEYSPGEVKLFAASSQTSFTQRVVNLEEFGGSYDPQNGIYLGLPNIPLWVHPDGDDATPRAELLKGVPGSEDIMVQIVMDPWLSYAYEVFNQSLGAYDTAGSFLHVTNRMSGGSVQRILSELEEEVFSDYAQFMDTADNYSAAPMPHLAIDSFLKPVDYFERMGQSNDLSSQQRTFPNFIVSNPLAASFSHTATAEREGNGMGDFIHTAGFRMSSASGGIPVQDLFDDDKGSWGSNNGRFGNKFAVILEIPAAPLQSIGQLQHASLNPSPYYPALSVGQSFRSPYLQGANQIVDSYTDSSYTSGQGFVFYDQNFLLNQALWDGYFFSSLAPQPGDSSYIARAPSLAQDPFVSDLPDVVDALIAGESVLANSRMILMSADTDNAATRAELLDPLTSAKHLGVKGAFNVNSTSVRAWQVFLAGYRDLAIQYFDATSSSLSSDSGLPGAAFLRHSIPNGPSADSGTDLSADQTWRGFMRLSDTELQGLAEAIVDQIKARAGARGTSTAPKPAMGLRDFINRMPNNSGYDESGTLQAAIDLSGINSARATNRSEFSTSTYNSNASNYRDTSFQLNTAAVAPLSLNQGDVLQAVGASIAARSDTFKVRAYGEAVDSFGKTSRSWCEAVFQRSTELVDPSRPERRFNMVSFRWLSPDEV
jgi:hypothetical protein